jgi:hypothetical protein
MDMPVFVNFGNKYQGEPLEEIMDRDPDYLEWVQAQDWFQKGGKYELQRELLTKGGANLEATPEHNKLQMNFLEGRFQDAFIELFGHDGSRLECEVKFEHLGVDVTMTLFRSEWDIQQIQYYDRKRGVVIEHHPRVTNQFFKRYLIEIKPTLGDEFPAVLRQIQSADKRVQAEYERLNAPEHRPYGYKPRIPHHPYKHVLLIDRLTTDVPFGQIKKYFKASGVELITFGQLILF